MTTVSRKKMTAEELLQLGRGHGSSDKRFELVKGDLIEMPPTGGLHGRSTSKFVQLLRNHVTPEIQARCSALKRALFLHGTPIPYVPLMPPS